MRSYPFIAAAAAIMLILGGASTSAQASDSELSFANIEALKMRARSGDDAFVLLLGTTAVHTCMATEPERPIGGSNCRQIPKGEERTRLEILTADYEAVNLAAARRSPAAILRTSSALDDTINRSRMFNKCWQALKSSCEFERTQADVAIHALFPRPTSR